MGVKGITPWNKGKKETRLEVLKKLSDSHIGLPSGHKGKKHSLEIRKKISVITKGRKLTPKALLNHKGFTKGYTPWNVGKPAWNRGKKGSIPWNKGKNSLIRGEKHWHWKGGITSINIQLRNSLEAKIWRRSVFERDNYICVWCEKRGGDLHADHIKPWSLFPELRFAIDNGRTLCVSCHKKTNSYGGNYFKNYKK